MVIHRVSDRNGSETRGGWRETPQDHRVGVYDVRQLSDEELERMIVEHQTASGARWLYLLLRQSLNLPSITMLARGYRAM